MRNSNFIFLSMAAIGMCFVVTACGLETDPSCSPPCTPDRLYHHITRGADGSYLNEKSENPIIPVKMAVNTWGWSVDNPELAAPPAKDRPVGFEKAYLEFNEEGWAFDENQKTVILDRIQQLKRTGRPIFLVTFTHGWHQSADTSKLYAKDALTYDAIKFDYFMARFAEQSRRLFELNGDDNAPVILGVYIGWRGESLSNSPFNEVTIGDRAKAADRIAGRTGPGSLHQALQEFATKIQGTGPDSRMLVIGHSLGGRMMSMMFLKDIGHGSLHPLGEHVLIAALEPAISADCYDPVFAKGIKGDPGMLPSFIAFTSKDDVAVVSFYPLARFVRPIAPPYCYQDSPARDQAIGNYPDYLTHSLQFNEVGEVSTPKVEPCGSPTIPKNRTWLFQEGVTFWLYPYFDVKSHCPQMSGNYSHSSMEYKATLMHEPGFGKAGAVWNIRIDKDLIDTGPNATGDTTPGTMSALHNAIASTALADIMGRITYAQMRWGVPGSDKNVVPEPFAKLSRSPPSGMSDF